MPDPPTSDHGQIEQRLRQDLHDTGELILGSAITSDLVSDTRRLGLTFRAHRVALTVVLIAAVAVAVLAIVISPALGRAAPTGNYRPPLPPDTIELGCYPLPRGLTLDFPYQVRSDGDVGGSADPHPALGRARRGRRRTSTPCRPGSRGTPPPYRHRHAVPGRVVRRDRARDGRAAAPGRPALQRRPCVPGSPHHEAVPGQLGAVDGVRMSTALIRGLRTDPLLSVCVVAALAVKVVLFARVADLPFRGDEVAYHDAGCALANLVRDLAGLHSPDGAELSTNVVGSGWFMPGMGVVLAPLYLVAPHADGTAARVWLGIVSGVVFVLAVASVRRSLGRWFAIALCAFPALVPVWVLLSLTAYGDLLAGLVLVILLARLVEVLRAGRAGDPPSMRDGLVLGVLGITVVYLRSSAVLAVAGMAVTAVTVLLWSLRGKERATGAPTGRRRRRVRRPAASLVDQRVGRARRPGDHDDVGPDRDGQHVRRPRGRSATAPATPAATPVWFAPVRVYAREVARATGEGEVSVLDEMSLHARKDVTPGSCAQDVVDNIERYRSIRRLRLPAQAAGRPARPRVLAVGGPRPQPADLRAGLMAGGRSAAGGQPEAVRRPAGRGPVEDRAPRPAHPAVRPPGRLPLLDDRRSPRRTRSRGPRPDGLGRRTTSPAGPGRRAVGGAHRGAVGAVDRDRRGG